MHGSSAPAGSELEPIVEHQEHGEHRQPQEPAVGARARPGLRLPTPSRRTWLAGGAACAAIVLFGAWLARRDDNAPPALDATDVARIADRTTDRAIDDLRRAPAASAEVYEAIRPSLVVVQAPTTTGDLGTGIVIDDAGSVLTALHVVEGAESVTLTFADGTRADAEISSVDAANDIAVLSPARLPEVVVPAVLGGGVRVGDEVVAVGHPLGLTASVSAGVVSGIDRSAPAEDGRSLEGLIQFDAAANPGNSGGPLLDRNGRVVGIVAGLANPTNQRYFIGIAFAVPIATAGGAAGAPPR